MNTESKFQDACDFSLTVQTGQKISKRDKRTGGAERLECPRPSFQHTHT